MSDLLPIPYTVIQTAAIIGVSDSQVRALIEAGELKAESVGLGTKRRHFRILPESIIEYRKRKEQERKQRINDRAYFAATTGFPTSALKGDRGRGRLRL